MQKLHSDDPTRDEGSRPDENNAHGIGLFSSQEAVSEKLTTRKRRERINEVERHIKAFDITTLAGLRNRAIVGLIGYGVASLDGALRMRVGDYYRLGNRGWFRRKENGKERQILSPPAVDAYLYAYLAAAGIENAPPKSWLFRAVRPGTDGQGISTLRLSRGHFVEILRRKDQQVVNEHLQLSHAEAQYLIESIRPHNVEAVRDRAIIGMMLYLSASPVQIGSMRARDYYTRDGWDWKRITRGYGSTEAPEAIVALLRDYLRLLQPPKSRNAPLFYSQGPMAPSKISEIVFRRMKLAGLGTAHRAHLGLAVGRQR